MIQTQEMQPESAVAADEAAEQQQSEHEFASLYELFAIPKTSRSKCEASG